MKRMFAYLSGLVALVLIVGSYSYALSPFQTVAGVGGPMPGTSLNCVSVSLSSSAVTQVLAANATREALWVTNTSTANATAAILRPTLVFLSSATTVVLQTDPALYSGVVLGPGNFQLTQSTYTLANMFPSSVSLTGGVVYQGAVSAFTETGVAAGLGRVTACELNP